MRWHERVCLSRTDSWAADQVGDIQDQFAAMDTKSASARKAEKSSSAHARHGARLASKTAKSTSDRGESRAAGRRASRSHTVHRRHDCNPRATLSLQNRNGACEHCGAGSHCRPYQFRYQNDRGTGGGRHCARGAYDGCNRSPRRRISKRRTGTVPVAWKRWRAGNTEKPWIRLGQ